MGVAEAEVTDITSGKASQKMPNACTCTIAYTVVSWSKSKIQTYTVIYCMQYVSKYVSNVFEERHGRILPLIFIYRCSRPLRSSSLLDVTA